MKNRYYTTTRIKHEYGESIFANLKAIVSFTGHNPWYYYIEHWLPMIEINGFLTTLTPRMMQRDLGKGDPIILTKFGIFRILK